MKKKKKHSRDALPVWMRKSFIIQSGASVEWWRKSQVKTCKWQTSSSNRMCKIHTLTRRRSCAEPGHRVCDVAHLTSGQKCSDAEMVLLSRASPGCLLGAGPDLREVSTRLLQPRPGKDTLTSRCVSATTVTQVQQPFMWMTVPLEWAVWAACMCTYVRKSDLILKPTGCGESHYSII